MSDVDQTALEVIDKWESMESNCGSQMKAQLQVEIIKALKTCRNDALDDAVTSIQGCEPVEPNVRRIRIDEAVGSIIILKDMKP